MTRLSTGGSTAESLDLEWYSTQTKHYSSHTHLDSDHSHLQHTHPRHTYWCDMAPHPFPAVWSQTGSSQMQRSSACRLPGTTSDLKSHQTQTFASACTHILCLTTCTTAHHTRTHPGASIHTASLASQHPCGARACMWAANILQSVSTKATEPDTWQRSAVLSSTR